MIVLFLFLFQILVQPVLAEEQVVLDFFYSGGCGSCKAKFPIIQELEQDEKYRDSVIFNWKDKSNNVSAIDEYETVYRPIFAANASFPLSFVVIKNETDRIIIIKNITVEHLSNVLDTYLSINNNASNGGNETTDESNETPGFELIIILCGISLVLLWKRRRLA